MDSSLKGFGIGLLVGVVLGILFAPRPGRETRAILRDKIDYIKNRAVDFMEEAGEQSTEMVKRGAEAVERTAETVKAKSAEAEGKIKEDRLARAMK
jgi:gas vesicle protein